MSGLRTFSQRVVPLVVLGALTAAMTTPAGAAPSPRGVNYGGSTSKDDPVVIQLSKDGKKVVAVSEEFQAKCTSGLVLNSLQKMRAKLAVSTSGAFSGVDPWSADLGDGSTALNVATLKGKVTGRKMTGSWVLHVDIVDAQGNKTDACDTSATFKAAATKGKVFAGFTSQGGPAVLELNASGKTIHHFHIGWRSNCQPSGIAQFGDTLVNFPIVAGVFGDDWTSNYGEPDTDQEILTYDVHGKFKPTKVTGTLRVGFKEVESGTVSVTCDTGQVGFSALTG